MLLDTQRAEADERGDNTIIVGVNVHVRFVRKKVSGAACGYPIDVRRDLLMFYPCHPLVCVKSSDTFIHFDVFKSFTLSAHERAGIVRLPDVLSPSEFWGVQGNARGGPPEKS
jgi:hypothetical protein